MSRVACVPWVVGIVALSWLSGCQQGETLREELPPAEVRPVGDADLRLDDSRWLGDAVAVGNLTVWPVYAASYPKLGDFLTLKEAEERGLAVVREVGSGGEVPTEVAQEEPAQENVAQEDLASEVSDSASPQLSYDDIGPYVQQAQSFLGATVHELVVENRGDLPILVCGGTIVKGGQQDRQIARDLVIAPKTTVPVDAFCVEAGRWTNVRGGSNTQGVFQASGGVTAKSVRSAAQYQGDQSAVWENVSKLNAFASNESQTESYFATVEDADEATVARRAQYRDAVRSYFEGLRAGESRPVGFAYAVDGKPVTVRTFAHPRLLDQQLDAFLEAMSVEADIAWRQAEADGRPPQNAPASGEDVIALVKRINEAAEDISETAVGNRTALRLSDFGGNASCEILLPADASTTEPDAEASATWVPVTQDWTAK